MDSPSQNVHTPEPPAPRPTSGTPGSVVSPIPGEWDSESDPGSGAPSVSGTPSSSNPHPRPYATPSPLSRSHSHVYHTPMSSTPPARPSSYSARLAAEERRASCPGATEHTPDSHTIRVDDGRGARSRRDVGAHADGRPSLAGTPSKGGRSAAGGQLVAFVNLLRFRGRDAKRLAVLIALNAAYSTAELLIGLLTGQIGRCCYIRTECLLETNRISWKLDRREGGGWEVLNAKMVIDSTSKGSFLEVSGQCESYHLPVAVR